MKKNIKPFIITLSMLGLISLDARAATPDQSSELKALEKQVSTLQHEVVQLKKEVKPSKNKATAQNTVSASAHPTKKETDQVLIQGSSHLTAEGTQYLPIDIDAPGRSFVSTGPYLGQTLQYSGSDLIINSPSINEDVALLKLRKKINYRLTELGVSRSEEHAHLLLSGDIETQANYKKASSSPHTTDIDVTAVNLDAYLLGPSTWTSGLFELSYENDIGSTSGVIGSNQRTANSRVFVNKAFITLGDFSVSPFYATIGQMYLPFGLYSSSMITNPMTKTLGRIKARALLVGYQGQHPNTFYTSAYVFKGDSSAPSDAKVVNNGGINLGYKFNHNDEVIGDVGGGAIGNLADSSGLQNTGNSPMFGGFGSAFTTCNGTNGAANVSCGNEHLIHRVPAYNLRGIVSIGSKWDLIGEYVMASNSFNPNDLSYNSHGARPQAFNAEAVYTFTAFERSNSLGLGFGMTKEALAIGLPAKRYAAVLNTSIWRDTLQSLEFRHDIDYSSWNTSSGSMVVGPTGTGGSDNVLTAQFNLYF